MFTMFPSRRYVGHVVKACLILSMLLAGTYLPSLFHQHQPPIHEGQDVVQRETLRAITALHDSLQGLQSELITAGPQLASNNINNNLKNENAEAITQRPRQPRQPGAPDVALHETITRKAPQPLPPQPQQISVHVAGLQTVKKSMADFQRAMSGVLQSLFVFSSVVNQQLAARAAPTLLDNNNNTNSEQQKASFVRCCSHWRSVWLSCCLLLLRHGSLSSSDKCRLSVQVSCVM